MHCELEAKPDQQPQMRAVGLARRPIQQRQQQVEWDAGLRPERSRIDACPGEQGLRVDPEITEDAGQLDQDTGPLPHLGHQDFLPSADERYTGAPLLAAILSSRIKRRSGCDRTITGPDGAPDYHIRPQFQFMFPE